jgi:hypothetical protein
MPEPVSSASTFELYRFSVEMADRVSARRGTANAFFLSLHTTLVTALALSASRLADSPVAVSCAVTTTGVLLAATWWLQLRSYRDLNRAKFAVILEMEQQLPVAVFTREWENLMKRRAPRWHQRYAELGTVERLVPVVFAALYLVLLGVRLAG